MTGIQLIVPLEDDTDNSTGSSHRMNQGTDAVAAAVSGARSTDDVKETNVDGKKSSNVLSDDLREQFETMKAVWRQSKRANIGGEEGAQDGRMASQEELKRKERETAVETALAVDEEISRWKTGIAELEAMLAAEEDSCSLDSGTYSDDDEVTEAANGHQGRVQGQQVAGVVPMRRHLRHRILPQQPPHPRLGFPSLAPIVPDEDDDDEDDGSA